MPPEGVDKRGDMGKGPRHTAVGETGNFEETGVPRGVPTGGSDMDGDGATT